MHHCSTSPIGNASLSRPILFEMHHCLCLTCWNFITFIISPQEIYRSLHLTCVKCVFVPTSLMGNVSWSPPHLWECFIVFSTPVGKGTLFVPLLWALPQCFHLTCGKYVLLLHSCGKCIIVSTSAVGNISLSLPNLWDIHHCLYLTCGKYIILST